MTKNISLSFVFIFFVNITVPIFSMVQKNETASSKDQKKETTFLENCKNVLASMEARRNGIAFLDACKNGDMDTVKHYIQNGGDKNFIYHENQNACQAAAAHGQLKILKYLIEQGFDEGMSKADNPFYIATEYGHIDIVKWYVVNRKIDVTICNDSGLTPLHTACIQKKALNVLRFLLDTHIDINQANHQGLRPVHYAIMETNLEALELLLNKGADLHVLYKGMTLLHFAAQQNRPEIVAFLIDKRKINPEVVTMDNLRCTPLQVAAVCGMIEPGKILIAKGANPNAINRANTNAFDLACIYKKIDFAKMLLPNTDINAYFGTCCKKTPLYNASENDRLEVVKFLLAHGADHTLESHLCEKHNQSTTIMGIAQAKGHHKIVDYIVDHLENIQRSKIATQKLLDEENEKRIKKESQQSTDNIHPKKKKKKKKRSGIAVPAKVLINLPEPTDESLQNANHALPAINLDKADQEFIDFVSLRNDRPGFKQSFIYLYKSKTIGLFTGNAQNGNIITPFVESIDNIGSSVAKNFLSNTSYSAHVETKENLQTDYYHNVSRTIDQKYGDWARIIVHDFRCNPSKKEYWAKQLGTEKVKDFWFELHASIHARVHKDKYPEEKARRLGPTGQMEYVVLAENLTESGNRVIVHRCFMKDDK